MKSRVRFLDLLCQFILTRFQEIEVLLEETDGLIAGQHVILGRNRVEYAADLGDGYAKTP